MRRLADLEAFLAVVEGGGQTAAARNLGRSLQSINRSLAALERSLGVALVQRTTRRSRPTEAGLAFHRRVKPALVEIAEATAQAAEARAEPAGLLRIGAPVAFASAHVAPAISEFLARYPRSEIELKVSDRPVDPLADGLDLAVRIRELPDSGLRARRLGDLRIVVFAAPGYLARHGRPRHPGDLGRHQCVVRQTEGEAEAWPFRIGGRRRLVRVQGRARSNNMAATIALVAGGVGLGLAPLWQIRDLLDCGLVELVLERFETAKLPIFAVMPPGRLPATKVSLFTDLLATRLKQAQL